MFNTDTAGLKRLLHLYYNIDISEAFIACADKHLTEAFLKIICLDKIPPKSRISWEQENPFIYHKDAVSRIEASLWMKYGSVKVSICWQSLSGRLYDIKEPVIDCNDLHFWIDGFNKDIFDRYTNPKWSLITFPETFSEYTKKLAGIPLSVSFSRCMDRQLSSFFELATGILINKEISLMVYPDHLSGKHEQASYSKGAISRITACLYINHHWNSLIVAWDSSSGIIYMPDDEIENCNDIRFRFEGFDTLLYHKQMYPDITLPFKLRNLSYELQVNRLDTNATIELFVKPGNEQQLPGFIEKVYSFIEAFNNNSESKGRKHGIVHNSIVTEKKDTVTIELDSGSAGAGFYKSLLQLISDSGYFNKVVMS